MKRYQAEGESNLFDACPPDEYFNSTRDRSKRIISSLHTFKHFDGQQKEDFYKGMIAGFRAALSILSSTGNLEMSRDLIHDANIVATFIVTEKRKIIKLEP